LIEAYHPRISLKCLKFAGLIFIFGRNSLYLRSNHLFVVMKDLNRLKVVLAEKKRTNKWLAEQLGKNNSTVSKWCTNTSQPVLQTLDRIAKLLDVDVKDLLNSTK